MLDQLLQYDTDLFVYLNNLGTTSWDGFWLFVTEKYASIPLYLVLLFLVFKKFHWKGTLLVLVLVALMITATDQLANLFKYVLFQRPRPCRVPELQDHIRIVATSCGRFGYFSAHAASSMATAVFVGLLLRAKYKYLAFILLFWAALIAYSRVYLGVHYPLDILTGMVFGGSIGFGFYRLQGWAHARFIS